MRQVLRLTAPGRFAPIAYLLAFLLLILGLMLAQAQTFCPPMRAGASGVYGLRVCRLWKCQSLPLVSQAVMTA
jgi:hypothetical protein